MTKNIHRHAIVLMTLFVLKGVAFAGLNISQIAAKYSPSVVTIVALDENNQPLGLGSGFFVSNSGDIATNHHVLDGCTTAIIKTTTGQKGNITEVIKDDSKLDLLVAKTTLTNTSPLPLGNSDSVTVGEDIIAIGNPAGLEGTVSKGIISGFRKAEGVRYIQITAPISPGSSGGPVFNLSGKVIGVATAYVTRGQNLNFAMPANYLKTLKAKQVKLASLPKMAEKAGKLGEHGNLVEVFDIHYSRTNPFADIDPMQIFRSVPLEVPIGLTSVTFGIRNDSSYTIRNIRVFFVYKNYNGQIVSYSAQEYKKAILPQLALQFTHFHSVSNWGKGWLDLSGRGDSRQSREGSVEIRILDYDIDRSVRTSPVDLILK